MATEIKETSGRKQGYLKKRAGVDVSLVRIPKPLIQDLQLVIAGDRPHTKQADTHVVHAALYEFLDLRQKRADFEEKKAVPARLALSPNQMIVNTDDVLVVPAELQVAIVEHLSDLNCLTWQEAVLRMLNSEITTAKEFSFD